MVLVKVVLGEGGEGSFFARVVYPTGIIMVNEERGGLVVLVKVVLGEGYVLIQSAEG